MSNKPKIALLACYDLTGLLMVNTVTPMLIGMGVEPVIYNTLDHRNRQFKIPTPPAVSMFNMTLLRDVMTPYLEEQGIQAGPNHTYRQLADIHGLEYHETADINAPEVVNRIAQDPDIIGGTAMRFLQILEGELIGVLREKGFVWNLHSGLLPEYKGLLTPYPAIENGEKEYGVTLHNIVRKTDEGDIIATARRPLDPSKPVLQLYLDMIPAAAELITANVAEFLDKGFVKATPQEDPNPEDYYTNPTTEQFRKAASKGVIYADALQYPELVASLFTPPNTMQSMVLKHRLRKSLTMPVTQPAEQSNEARFQIA